MTNISLFLCMYKFVSNMGLVANCKHGNRNIMRQEPTTVVFLVVAVCVTYISPWLVFAD